MIDVLIRRIWKYGDENRQITNYSSLLIVRQLPMLLSTDRSPVNGRDLQLYEDTDSSQNRHEHTDMTVSIIMPWSFNLWARRRTMINHLQRYLEQAVMEKFKLFNTPYSIEVILHLTWPAKAASKVEKRQDSQANNPVNV